MRAVLDTNVLVSAFIFSRGIPHRILQAWRLGAFEFVTSEPLLAELERTLAKPRLSHRYRFHESEVEAHRPTSCPSVTASHRYRFHESEVEAFVAGLRDRALVVIPVAALKVVDRDPDDNMVIEAAIEAQASFIVTGDSDLIDLGSFQGIAVVRPAQFIETIGQA